MECMTEGDGFADYDSEDDEVRRAQVLYRILMRMALHLLLVERCGGRRLRVRLLCWEAPRLIPLLRPHLLDAEQGPTARPLTSAAASTRTRSS